MKVIRVQRPISIYHNYRIRIWKRYVCFFRERFEGQGSSRKTVTRFRDEDGTNPPPISLHIGEISSKFYDRIRKSTIKNLSNCGAVEYRGQHTSRHPITGTTPQTPKRAHKLLFYFISETS
ncbi:hypothetical protein NPIL_127281 [Nephila pilipes]|uniref:Uncharacterized protein n=1 Tax=Nephila pilipes TaxID=299642 RepID=A0A8X6K251_NEPPI|nr:hypothetical protein NPIL_127281 [Nephila pilipes]